MVVRSLKVSTREPVLPIRSSYIFHAAAFALLEKSSQVLTSNETTADRLKDAWSIIPRVHRTILDVRFPISAIGDERWTFKLYTVQSL